MINLSDTELEASYSLPETIQLAIIKNPTLPHFATFIMDTVLFQTLSLKASLFTTHHQSLSPHLSKLEVQSSKLSYVDKENKSGEAVSTHFLSKVAW